MKTLYVGNLSFNTEEAAIQELFSAHGAVESVRLMKDRMTGKSRGFAFVEMEDDVADAAMEAVNGQEIDGRPLRVNEARERGDRPPRDKNRSNRD